MTTALLVWTTCWPLVSIRSKPSPTLWFATDSSCFVLVLRIIGFRKPLMASLLLGLQFAGLLQLPGILPLLGSRKSRMCITELFQREFCWHCLLQLWSGDGLQRQGSLPCAGQVCFAQARRWMPFALTWSCLVTLPLERRLHYYRYGTLKTRGHAAKHRCALRRMVWVQL